MQKEQTTWIDWDGKQVPLERFITDLFGEDTPYEEVISRKKRIV